MKVVCINNEDALEYLTLLRIYEVVDETSVYFTIEKPDRGKKRVEYFKERFIPLNELPEENQTSPLEKPSILSGHARIQESKENDTTGQQEANTGT